MQSAPKTLVIGLGGIAWGDLVARIGNGTAPGFAALLRRGVGLRLIDDMPASRAGAWATLSTGVLAHQHGIIGLDEAWAGGLRPTGRASWRRAPVWRQLADAGLRGVSVAWPFTRPGMSWEGVHVDDRLAHATGRNWHEWLTPRDVAPAEWRDALAELRVHPADVGADLLAPFVPALGGVDQRTDRGLIDLAIMIARLSTNHTVAQLLLKEAEWDVAFLFHSWMAAVGERFAGAGAPFDHVMDAAWTLIDTMVAITIAAIPRDAVVVLVSLGWAGQPGFVAAAGPGIAPGVRSDVAHSRDLAPSLLARYGLRDEALPGRILFGGSDRPLCAAPPARDLRRQSSIDDAALARACGFGFVPPTIPKGWAAKQLITLASVTVREDPVSAGRYAEAALQEAGEEPFAIGLLAASAVADGRIDELPALADRIAAASPGHVWEALVRGGYHALRDEAAQARPHLARAEQEGGPDERIRVGAAWLALERPEEARRAFEAVLAAEPHRVDAMIGLGLALAHRPAEAEPVLRRALAFDPARADARTVLTDLLRRVGRSREADQIEAAGLVYAPPVQA